MTDAEHVGSSGLVERLREVLGPRSDVQAAWVFGSVARGTSRSWSDVDVAVLVADAADADLHLMLIEDVGRVVGTGRADVVVLNDAPPALAYRVLRDGQLIHAADERARVRFWVTTVDRYLDMRPMRELLAAGLGHRIEEGRFGRS